MQKTVLGEILSAKMDIVSPKSGSAVPVYVEKALKGWTLAGRCLRDLSTIVVLDLGLLQVFKELLFMLKFFSSMEAGRVFAST